MMLRALVALVLTAFVVGACNSPPREDWSDPAWIKYRLEVGDSRAIDEFTRLAPEQKAELVPVLIAEFDKGSRQTEIIRALLNAADSRARDTFRTALSKPDDAIAGIAARGLAAINDTSSSAAVAERMSRVTESNAYPAFFEALMAIPTNEAADSIASVMMRPAARIGGPSTVRRGCQVMTRIENPSSEAIEAMVFGLANLTTSPQAGDDPQYDCELALVTHGDAGVARLREMMRGENLRANEHLLSIQFLPVVAQLRATAVLARIASPVSIQPLIEWFSSSKSVAEVQDLPVERAMQWYEFHMQMFGYASEGLARARTPEAIEVLRRLESVDTPESLLDNFRVWFQLSADAEMQLRNVILEALFKVGGEAEYALFWERATSGTLVSARDQWSNGQMRLNALHVAGRGARQGDMERFRAVFAAQRERDQPRFVSTIAYFALAEACGDDVACYSAALADPGTIANSEVVTSFIPADVDAQSRGIMETDIQQFIRLGSVWQLGTRLKGDAASAGALLDALSNPSLVARLQALEALNFSDNLPADAKQRLEAALEQLEGSTASGVRELRHTIRVALARLF